MKKAIATTFAVVSLVVSSSAIPTLLNTTPFPGTQPANAGDQVVADWLDSLIPGGDQIGSGASLLVDQGDSAPVGYPTFGANVNPLTLPVGDYDYLVLHWGGSGGGTYVAYDLTSCLDGSTYSFSDPVGNHGLSFYRFYNPNGTNRVPETGSSYVLLSIGLGALSMLRRKLG